MVNRKRRVLMLCHRVPFPLDRGDRIRAYHTLEYLSRHNDVAIACTSDEPVRPEQRDALGRLASRVAIQRISRPVSKIRGLGALATGGAITPACFYRRSLARTIRRWHDQEPFDVLLTYCTSMIGYARVLTGRDRVPGKISLSPEELTRPYLRHVIDLVDVDSVKWLDYSRQSRWPMRWLYATEANRLRRIEAGRFDFFDGVTVVSEAEARVYRRYVAGHPGLNVVRHAVDLDYFSPQPDRGGRTIVFVGVLNYRPNADGITWFVDHVMPLLARRLDGVTLKIIGRHPTMRIRALGRRKGVEVVGSVPDVRPYLRDAAAVVAPLQIARGVQTKVLQAMASGRVVVCSAGAADGIDATDGKHLLVARDAHQWADHIACVLGDSGFRTRLSGAARTRMEQAYDWQACLRPLDRLLSGPRPVAGSRQGGDGHTLGRLPAAA